MLRIGLTGELGSGKSTVARFMAALGTTVLSSDEMARAMMQPGEPVYVAIVERFGPTVVLPGGALDRRELARLAFDPNHQRVEDLNAIVHPAVLAEQERQIQALAQTDPHALVVVESALLFTTRHAGGEAWRKRFDQIVLVTAPDELKVQRFLERSAGGRDLRHQDRLSLKADAEARLQAQRIPPDLEAECLLLSNAGSLETLRKRTEEVFQQLRHAAQNEEV